MPRENFYILLELSPTETNASHIEAVIKKKQTEWSKLRNHPTKGRRAQQYLGLIPEIKKVMGDHALRQAEANDAKKRHEQEQKETFHELDEAIKLLSLKGKMLEKEVRELAKEFKMIPEAEIRRRITVKIIKDNKPKPQTKPLDSTTAKVISDALKIVRKSSLYDFLDLSPTSSLKTLQQRTSEKDLEIKKVAQKTAEITASGTLIGQCQNVFKTQNQREAYDATLAQERLAELDNKISLVGKSSGNIDLQQYEALLKKAVGFGLGLEAARQYILEYCQKNSWAVETAEKSAVADMQQCGVCGLLNLAKARHCEKCGYPLEIACPQCKTPNPSTAQFCRQCGFAVGDMPNALRLLRRGQMALAEKDLNLAAQLLQQANIYWPHYPEISQTLQSLQSEKQAINKIVQQIHRLINQRYFYQARPVLAQLRQLDSSHPELSLSKTIEQKIAAAETWLRKAKTTSEENARIDVYSAALAEAKDCREALDEMARLPPKPAHQLQANPTQRAISLRWLPSSSRGDIIYRVIRKTDTFPTHHKDGNVIGETAQTLLEDTATEVGQEYYYAVYAVRGDAASQRAAMRGPIMQLAEIKGLQVIPGDYCINLKWQTPPKALAVEVWRQENGVPTKNNGQKLTGVRLDGVTDSKLKNGTRYGYLISVIFQDSHGKSHLTQGISCQSRPIEPPQPVSDLSVTKQGDSLEINWTPPNRGTVQLFYSEQALFSEGDHLPLTRLSELGTPIMVQRQGYVRWPIGFQGLISIVPVTVEEEIAVIGRAKAVTSLNEVSQLRGQINYNKLYLEWDWPPGTRQVLVAYSHNNYPSDPNDSLATRQQVTRHAYDKDSAFVISKPQHRDYYFSVFVAAGEGDQVIYSSGEHCFVANSGYQEIFYQIKLKKGLFGIFGIFGIFGKVKSIQLILTSRNGNISMPEAVLVKKIGNPPLRRAEGSVIYAIAANTVIGKKPLVISIPHHESQKNSYAKLFLTDKKDEQRCRLVQPNQNKLLLG
jgi:ribosomal protein L40E